MKIRSSNPLLSGKYKSKLNTKPSIDETQHDRSEVSKIIPNHDPQVQRGPSNKENIDPNLKDRGQYRSVSSDEENTKRKISMCNIFGIGKENAISSIKQDSCISDEFEASVGQVPVLNRRSQFKSAPRQKDGVSQKDDAQIHEKMSAVFGCNMVDKGDQQQVKEKETAITSGVAVVSTIEETTRSIVEASEAGTPSSPSLSIGGDFKMYHQDDCNVTPMQTSLDSIILTPITSRSPKYEQYHSTITPQQLSVKYDQILTYGNESKILVEVECTEHKSNPIENGRQRFMRTEDNLKQYDGTTNCSVTESLAVALDRAKAQDSEEDVVAFISSLKEGGHGRYIRTEKYDMKESIDKSNIFTAGRHVAKHETETKTLKEGRDQNRIQHTRSRDKLEIETMLPVFNLIDVSLQKSLTDDKEKPNQNPKQNEDILDNMGDIVIPIEDEQAKTEIGIMPSVPDVGGNFQCRSVAYDQESLMQNDDESIELSRVSSLTIERGNFDAELVPSTLDPWDRGLYQNIIYNRKEPIHRNNNDQTDEDKGSSNDSNSGPTKSKPLNLPKIFKIARQELGALFLALLLMIGAEATSLLNPILLANAYDSLVSLNMPSSEKISHINQAMTLVVVVHGAGLISTFLYSVVMAAAGERIFTRLRKDLFSIILKQEITFLNERKSSKLARCLNSDITIIQIATRKVLSVILPTILKITLCSSFMFLISPKLAGISIALMVVIFLVSLVLGGKVNMWTKKCQDTLESVHNYSTKTLASIRLIQASAMEDKEVEQYCDKIGDPDRYPFWLPEKANRRTTTYGIGLNKALWTSVFHVLGFGVTSGYLNVSLWFGFKMVLDEEITLGALVAFQCFVYQISLDLAQTSIFLTQVTDVMGASRRINELLESDPTVVLPPENIETELDTLGMSHMFLLGQCWKTSSTALMDTSPLMI